MESRADGATPAGRRAGNAGVIDRDGTQKRAPVRGRPLELEAELLEAFERSGRVSALLVRALSDAVWRLPPPGGRGRTIAAIVAHMQGVRRTFAKMGGARPVPAALDRRTVSRARAAAALDRSTDVLVRLFARAFASGRARVPGMPRRAVDTLAYLLQHDAHHRGQITMVATSLGHRFEADDVMRIWGWKALRPR